ncbi:hypothetical protein V1477_013380 [Vespula maculifrons]|uniref:Uncharacterized protein n=2 Tax=Vespula TaxID=7451 RepID=A0A834J821_VESVU|nr:hypothetical protein HZH66_012988 [Vespula vulgaris]
MKMHKWIALACSNTRVSGTVPTGYPGNGIDFNPQLCSRSTAPTPWGLFIFSFDEVRRPFRQPDYKKPLYNVKRNDKMLKKIHVQRVIPPRLHGDKTQGPMGNYRQSFQVH